MYERIRLVLLGNEATLYCDECEDYLLSGYVSLDMQSIIDLVEDHLRANSNHIMAELAEAYPVEE